MSAQLEDLVPGTVIGGVVPAKDVTSVALSWHGGAAVTLTYRDPDGLWGARTLSTLWIRPQRRQDGLSCGCVCRI